MLEARVAFSVVSTAFFSEVSPALAEVNPALAELSTALAEVESCYVSNVHVAS